MSAVASWVLEHPDSTKSGKLIHDMINDMTGKFDPQQPRPSAIGDCARKQVYSMMQEHPSNDKSMEEIEGLAVLGHIVEGVLAREWSKNYPGRVYHQFEIKLPYKAEIGDREIDIVSHPDIWIPSLQRDVEVKVQGADAKGYEFPRRRDIEQLMFRLHMHHKYRKRDSVHGELVIFFRETFFDADKLKEGMKEPYTQIVEYDRELGEELESRFRWILQCGKMGYIPDRPEDNSPNRFPCRTAGQYYVVECPYRSVCWDTDDEETRIAIVKEADELINEYAETHRERALYNKESKALDKHMKEILAQMQPIFNAHGDAVSSSNGVVVRRSWVDEGEVSFTRKGHYRYYVSGG